MQLLSYGEMIPMRATRRYTGDELVGACQKRMARFAALARAVSGLLAKYPSRVACLYAFFAGVDAITRLFVAR